MLNLGLHDGYPMFCLTSRRALDAAAPSAAYLRTILLGLYETWGWTAAESARYLIGAAGVTPTWTPERITGLGAGPTDHARGRILSAAVATGGGGQSADRGRPSPSSSR